jgi:hypothetical protein
MTFDTPPEMKNAPPIYGMPRPPSMDAFAGRAFEQSGDH